MLLVYRLLLPRYFTTCFRIIVRFSRVLAVWVCNISYRDLFAVTILLRLLFSFVLGCPTSRLGISGKIVKLNFPWGRLVRGCLLSFGFLFGQQALLITGQSVEYWLSRGGSTCQIPVETSLTFARRI